MSSSAGDRGDELLKGLGKAAREERAAAEADAHNAPALDEVTRERMMKGALDELVTSKSKSESKSKSKSKSKTVAQPSRRARTVAAIVSVVALAAAIVFFVGFRKSALPSYTLSVQGGVSEWRGEDASSSRNSPDRIVVRADGELEILLRPADPVTHRLQARAFAVSGDTTKVLPTTISAQGVVRVAGRAGELLSPDAREWTVVVFVGEEEVPTSIAAARTRDDLRRAETIVVVTSLTTN